MINTIWFIVLGAMLVGYAVLDGFDLGVGAVHFLVGRRTDERETAINAIGPVWNGNEVWLIAAGGSMVVAFPHLYAAAFSGFYLALMVVLWLLILRGVAIELRHQVDNALWRDACDATFSAASALLAVLFGVAVGNVLRGVPLDAHGEFQGTFALLLNPFALLCGLLGLAALSLHGSTYLAMKTEGEVQRRARRAVLPLLTITVALLVAVVVASALALPAFGRGAVVFGTPALAFIAYAIARSHRRGRDTAAFVGSCLLIAATLYQAGAGLYPRLLPGLPGSAVPALDIYNTASAPSSMKTALGVYLVGMAIVAGYLVKVYRVWRGKVRAGEGYHA